MLRYKLATVCRFRDSSRCALRYGVDFVERREQAREEGEREEGKESQASGARGPAGEGGREREEKLPTIDSLSDRGSVHSVCEPLPAYLLLTDWTDIISMLWW